MIAAAVKDQSRFGKRNQERKYVVNFQKKESIRLCGDQLNQVDHVLRAILLAYILLFLIFVRLLQYHIC